MPLISRLMTMSALGLAIGCAPQAKPVDTAAEEAAIRTIDSKWNDYLKTQNDSAIGAIYAADAILFPPNMPRVTGADPIRKFWAGIWPLKASLELTPVTIRVAGEWAMEEGSYSFSIPGPTGATRDAGKYLVNWHKQDGTWRAVQDIWNSDNPPPPPAK
jgi:ketosteroid isomerase-like protein